MRTRLPDAWTPSPETAAIVRRRYPHVDGSVQLIEFSRYWKSKPGAGGEKTNWDSTFRNWMKTAAASSRSRNGSNAALRNTPKEDEFEFEMPSWMGPT